MTNIPKKLTVNPLGTDIYAGNVAVVNKINQLIDYLQAKEEASIPKYAGWYCPKCSFVCYNASERNIEEHLVEHPEEASKKQYIYTCSCSAVYDPELKNCPACGEKTIEAKEDKSYKAASSVCCDFSFRLEGDTKEGTMFHVCNNCNKACDLKLTQKEVEASKGECGECLLRNHALGRDTFPGKQKEANPPESKGKCYCQCHALDNFGWDQNTHKCEHCNPPENEEDWEKKLGSYLSDRGDKPILNDYIRDNFVSKEKIKREVELWFCLKYSEKQRKEILKYLGLGD